MLENIKNVLILAPHPDDAEFGLGGTIAQMIHRNYRVHLAVFSTCEKSTPKNYEPGIIEEELKSSCTYLGIPKTQLHQYHFEVRDFPRLRQDILENMILLRDKLQPQLVFLPSSKDVHQDHDTIHHEGKRAFKYYNLLGYEMPWNNFEFVPRFYNILTEAFVEKKIGALKIYKSQAGRTYLDFEFVKSLAKLRGTQVQAEYAEAFEVIRFISK